MKKVSMINKYVYCLEWYNENPNNCHRIGSSFKSDNSINFKDLNSFFVIKLNGLDVKRINIMINRHRAIM